LPECFRIPEAFANVDEVVRGLAALEHHFTARGSRGGVFVTAYLITTRVIGERLARGAFDSPESVGRYVVAYANRYRRALFDYCLGHRALVPRPWRIAFDSSEKGPVLRDLLLGINAHINYDQPFAVLEAGLDVSCPRCYGDHARINEALRTATPLVRRRVTELYQPGLRIPSRLAGPLIDRLVVAGFRRAREQAWRFAAALSGSRGRAAMARVESELQGRAVQAARRIAAVTPVLPALGAPRATPRLDRVVLESNA
jgi:hypothetical protein